MYNILISFVCKAMMIPDDTPDTLLESVLVIVSMPKDNRASLKNSDNYWCIVLFCVLCKTSDIWIMKKNSDVFKSCNLQFAFKVCMSLRCL